MGGDVEDACSLLLGAMLPCMSLPIATLVDHPIGPPAACTDRCDGTYGSSDVSGIWFGVK